jgi:hypothetical protein
MKRHTGAAPENRLANFEASFPQALTALEIGVHDLLSTGWEESRRRRAHEMSTALCDAAKISGWKETGGILQAISSLLALPLVEILSVRETVRDKLLELLGLLRGSARSETA